MESSVLKALIDDSIDSDDDSNYQSLDYELSSELRSGCSGKYDEPSSGDDGDNDGREESMLSKIKKNKKKILQFSIGAAAVIVVIAILLILRFTLGKSHDHNLADFIILNSVPYSVAIKGNRIMRIGTAGWVEKKYDRKKTKLIDAGGHFISAGYIDNGAYLFLGALTKFGNVTVLKEERTPEEVVNSTRTYIESWDDKSSSIVGMSVSYISGLNRTFLDNISTTRPVIIFSYDLYYAWANTYALEKAGILYPNETQKKYIYSDENGLATGELVSAEGFGYLLSQMREAGAILSHRLVDLPINDSRTVPLIGGQYEETIKQIVRKTIDDLPHYGITSMRVHGIDREALAMLDALNAEKEFPVRIQTFFSVHPSDMASLTKVFILGRMGATGDRVRCVGARFWLDGRVETKTAYVKNAYPDTDDNYGILYWKMEDLVKAFSLAGNLGLAVSARAVGDAAVEVAIKAFTNSSANVFKKDKLWRQIDNAEISGSDEARLFAKNDISLSTQPMHAMPTDDWVSNVPTRVLQENSFAWKTFVNANVKVAYGSEWPVNRLSVVRSILHLTLTRVPLVSDGADQRISLDTSIMGYTEVPGAAFGNDGDNLGLIAEGYLADLVLSTEATITENTAPEITVCNGVVTYNSRL